MDEKDKQATLERYSNRFKKYGYSPLTLGWGEKDRSRLRFEIFTQLVNFEHASILDFGCGFGDFFSYVASKNICPKNYTGVDINEDLITKAKELYPSANFRCENLLSSDSPDIGKYDYVISSGVFNHKVSNSSEFVAKAFQMFDKVSEKGFCCNFLSNKIDPQFFQENLNYSSPEKILTLAYKYSRNVILRNDYMPFEFTVCVRKNVSVHEHLTVFEGYEKYA